MPTTKCLDLRCIISNFIGVNKFDLETGSQLKNIKLISYFTATSSGFPKQTEVVCSNEV